MPEVESVGWGSRLGNAIGGVLVGLLMFLVSFPILFLNEGRAVHRARTLEEGGAACINVEPDKIDPANETKLIHVIGEATTTETLKDEEFGVSAKALKLDRKVQIYQWVERSEKKTEKKLGGGEKVTTYYHHKKEWVSEPVDSSGFKDDDGEFKGMVLKNQGTLPYADHKEQAKVVMLGAFKLTDGQTDRITPEEKLPITTEMLSKLPAGQKGKFTVKDGNFYMPFKSQEAPSESSEPQIGDVMISYTELKPQKVSVMARQFQGSFEPWIPPSRQGSIDLLQTGSVSKELMFKSEQESNVFIAWLLRLVGFILMAVGIYLVFNPLVVFADVLPLLGGLLGAGIAVFAILIALPLTLITIALGWVVYRPMIGIPLLAVGLAILIGALFLGRGHKSAA